MNPADPQTSKPNTDAAGTATTEPEGAEDETLHVVDMPGPPDEDPVRESIVIDDWGRASDEPYRDTEIPGLQ